MTEPGDRRKRTWVRRCAVAAVVALFAIELYVGWPSLADALSHLRAPDPRWLAGALVAELAAMGMYARMQRSLLLSAGLRVPIYRHVALAYAAHSLSVTLPGGPAFSTRFNYQQMRRFGASPAVASWCIALSGILSAAALAAVSAVSALASHGTPPWYSLGGLAAVIVLITLGIRRLARRPATLEPMIRTTLGHLNRLRRRPADTGVDQVRGFVTQLTAARLTPGYGAAAATFAVLNWLIDAVCLWMCFRAVSPDPINATQLLLAFCAGYAAGTLTIIPGGLGIIDSALILGLVTGGVSTATAIATVVLYRLISFCFIIGIGWITWLVIRHRYRDAMAVTAAGPG
ncbi:lysylphosphatidylglycerol synthase transmembrane domain-containing protein [Mangrovihabitans endophyticus]|uniref:Membrane protein n=1 Tax=Mangrovihabitans endophyticus TaxID=1751298 RepID=A0A8J3C3P9_9ACTN|nr:YbhN family protein [Mangrovihabitans endophyticus]GGL10471.1 membrane protein [Mangrovihabitans endophyticus]